MSTISITYAGHSAVFVEIGGAKVAIDPWLKGNPLCPSSLVEPPALDLIVLTHGHADHASDAVRVQRASGAKLAATYELAMIMINEGVEADQVIPMNKGGVVQINKLSVRLTDAKHSSSFDGKHGTVYAGEACGVVLSSDKVSLYHAGDTSLFSDMRIIGELYKPNVALLPIGDRFTMGPEEAALAASYIKPKVALPIHYKTFDLLTGTYDEFSRACARYGLECSEMEVGKELSF